MTLPTRSPADAPVVETAPVPRVLTLDASEAVVRIAYRLSEVIAIYPITPASAMGEHPIPGRPSGAPTCGAASPT